MSAVGVGEKLARRRFMEVRPAYSSTNSSRAEEVVKTARIRLPSPFCSNHKIILPAKVRLHREVDIDVRRHFSVVINSEKWIAEFAGDRSLYVDIRTTSICPPLLIAAFFRDRVEGQDGGFLEGIELTRNAVVSVFDGELPSFVNSETSATKPATPAKAATPVKVG